MNKNRKTSHILNVFQYDESTGAVTLPSTLVLTAPASNDNSTKVGTTAWVRTYVTGLSYLTGNQSISVSGDATGSGTTSIALTLANSGVTAGTYGSTTLVPVVTVDAKGRVTSVTTAAISGSLTFTGDVTGTGTTGTSTGLTLAASGVTAGTYTKVTVDTKGRVTVGASATTSDISEGTNLYYTDARVLSYLSANTYATQSYVGTQVANLVAAAPATLDTLNELAAALGNDPSFATTVSTSIGTKVPQTRTLTINGTGYDLSADRSWTINSMVYPSAGIALSTGTAWGTSITDNSANWNTAYGWGNHASGGYLTSATAATTYASLTGAYANPAFVASLAYSKITGVPAFLTSYTETDPYRVTSVAVSGTSTKTITLTRADASTVTTTWTDIDTDTNTYVTSAGFSGGTLTLTRNDAGTVTVSLDGRYYLATNPSSYITSSGSISGTAAYATQWGTPSGYANFSSTAISASVGWLFGTTGNGTYAPVSLASVATLLSLGSLAYSSATIPTNNNQLTNGAGYITSITSGNVTTALGYTPYNATNPAGYITSSGSISGNAGTATGQQSGVNFTLNTGGAGYGLVGVYNPDVHQGFFAMGPAYVLGAGGTLANFYGVSWSYDYSGRQLNTGYNLQHCMAVANAGTVYTVIGQGIWTSGVIRANGAISAGGTISASNYSGTHSGSSSGTNTGDQTNISGNAATATTAPSGTNRGDQIHGSAGVTPATSFASMPSAMSGFTDNWGGGDLPSGMSHVHGIACRHFNNASNNWGWHMVGQYDQPGDLRVRWVNAGTWTGYYQLVTTSNIGSQKANGALKLWAESHPNDYYIVNNWTGTHWRFTSNHGSPVRVGYADDTGSIGSAVGNAYYWSGIQYFETNNGGSAVNNSNSAKLQAYSSSNNTAFMSFHRGGYYAINMGLDNDNVFRIGGWSASGNRFQMDMSGNLTMAGDITAYSDSRVKENIATIENALSKVLALRGVSYNRIDSDDKKTKIGVIAQETLPIVPEVVNQDNDGMYNVSYGNLAGLFIEAIKEQQKEIEELKTLIYGITR